MLWWKGCSPNPTKAEAMDYHSEGMNRGIGMDVEGRRKGDPVDAGRASKSLLLDHLSFTCFCIPIFQLK